MNRRGFFGALTAFFSALFAWRWSDAKPARHTWEEYELYPSQDVVVQHAHWSQTEVYVEHPQYFQPGDVVHVPRTGENFYVDNVSLLSLHVRRGIGVEAASIPEGDPVWILGNAGEISHERDAQQVALAEERLG